MYTKEGKIIKLMINFEARCTSLKYGKSYDHGVNLLLLIKYFCIETTYSVRPSIHLFQKGVSLW